MENPGSARKQSIIKIRIYGIHEIHPPFAGRYNDPGSWSFNFISANQYPYLQLLWNASDSTKSTSVNLAYWRSCLALCRTLPLLPTKTTNFLKDTIDQGDEVRWKFNVYNAGDLTVDSFQVTYKSKTLKIIFQMIPFGFITYMAEKKRWSIKHLKPVNDRTQYPNCQHHRIYQVIPKHSSITIVVHKKFLVISDKIPPVIHVFLMDAK